MAPLLISGVVMLCAVIVGIFTLSGSRQKPLDPTVRLGSGEFFDGIATNYDLANRVVSFGFDQSWRRTAVQSILPAASVLDVSTGTGDVVAALLQDPTPPTKVYGVDPSAEMGKLFQEKFERYDTYLGFKQRGIRKPAFVKAAAEELPFGDGEFDAVVVSFGVRNFEDREKGLQELARVLKPGGKLAVLELSLSKSNGFHAKVKRFVVTHVVPVIGGILTGHPEAYRYLSVSMEAFPSVEKFSQMLRDAGLSEVDSDQLGPLGFGPHLYLCKKAVL